MDAADSDTPRYRKLGHGGRIGPMLEMRMTLDYQAERKDDAYDCRICGLLYRFQILRSSPRKTERKSNHICQTKRPFVAVQVTDIAFSLIIDLFFVFFIYKFQANNMEEIQRAKDMKYSLRQY